MDGMMAVGDTVRVVGPTLDRHDQIGLLIQIERQIRLSHVVQFGDQRRAVFFERELVLVRPAGQCALFAQEHR
jgi:hypothetical protein